MAFKFKRRLQPRANLDMIPMIDIIFQLIIFFMVATQFKTTTGMELELPKASLLSVISTAPLRVTVIDQNNIAVEGKSTNLKNLNNVLSQEVAKNQAENKSAIIYGQQSMEYQLLIDVMDLLRINGYNSIDLALRKR